MERDFWRRFAKNELALAGAIIVVCLFVVSLFAPWISPYDPTEIHLDNILAAPSAKH